MEPLTTKLEDESLEEIFVPVLEQGPTFLESIRELKGYPIDFVCTLFWIILIISVIASLFVYPLAIAALYSDGSWVYSKYGIGSLELTREQQINLDSGLFKPREHGLDQFWYDFHHITGIDPENPKIKRHIGIRSEFQYNSWNCSRWDVRLVQQYSEYQSAYYEQEYGHHLHELYENGTKVPSTAHYLGNPDLEIRVRNWLYVWIGDDDRTSTVDLKRHTATEIGAYHLDFTPSAAQQNTSSEKLEQGL